MKGIFLEKAPDRIFVEKGKEKKYKKLKDEPASPFHKRELLDIFLCALALGYLYRERRPIEKKEGLILTKTIANNRNAISLFISIGVAERGSLSVIGNMKEIFQIVEEYANGGIDILFDLVFKPGDPLKELEVKAIEILKKPKKGLKKE